MIRSTKGQGPGSLPGRKRVLFLRSFSYVSKIARGESPCRNGGGSGPRPPVSKFSFVSGIPAWWGAAKAAVGTPEQRQLTAGLPLWFPAGAQSDVFWWRQQRQR